ncbi:MAG: prolipoprotein diacylglyceryl transferase family protein [Myxococcota bacterium]
MWPYLAKIELANGAVQPFGTYGLLIVVAFSLAIAYVQWRAPKVGFHPDKLIGVYVAAFIGGMLGARVLYMIAVEPAATFRNPLNILSPTGGGFAFYGGLIGGGALVLSYAAQQGFNGWKLADILMPAVILGHGVGRLACFFAGCCHGVTAPHMSHGVPLLGEFSGGEIWLSSAFPYMATEFLHPDTVSRVTGIPLYPTQLWSVVIGTSLFAVLAYAWTKRRFDGQIAAIALMTEPVTRVFVEAFRSDHRGYALTFPVNETLAGWLPGMAQAGDSLANPVMGLTTSQFIGLAMVGVGIAIYATRFNEGVDEEVEVSISEEDILENLAS